MDRNALFHAVEKIFRDVFDDEELVITFSTNSQDIEEWDSLEHINLIVAMEQQFNIKFEMAEVYRLKDVGEIVELIQMKRS